MLSPPFDRSGVAPAARNPAYDIGTPLFNGYADQVGALYPDEPPAPPLRPGKIAQ